MNTLLQQASRRRARVRAKISGTPQRPRLSVKISARHIIAQVIDDTQGKTLAYVSTVGQKPSGTMTKRATAIGKSIAEAATKAGVKQVSFDRGRRIYHGRLHALAEAARNAGLEF